MEKNVKRKEMHRTDTVDGLREECAGLCQVTSDIVVRHMPVLRQDDAVLFGCKKAPEGFWQAAPRDFEDSIVGPTHCSPHCFSSRASVPEFSLPTPTRETHSQSKQPTESFHWEMWRLRGKPREKEEERERESE